MARPSKYKPEFCDLIIAKEFKKGATKMEVADFLGVAPTTIENWRDKYPEFMGALYEAKEKCDNNVERSLYESAIGYSHQEEKVHFDKEGNVSTYMTTKRYPPNPLSMKMWLTNRKPEDWREREIDREIREITVTIEDAVPDDES